jgi:hypothetical protein
MCPIPDLVRLAGIARKRLWSDLSESSQLKTSGIDSGPVGQTSHRPPSLDANNYRTPEHLPASKTYDSISPLFCLRSFMPKSRQTNGAVMPSHHRKGEGEGGYEIPRCASPSKSWTTLAGVNASFSVRSQRHCPHSLAPDIGVPRRECGGEQLWNAGTTPYSALIAF